jgi:AraC-like DNA-binding protein
MSGQEIADLVAAFSDILTVLRNASEKNKAEVYGRLGQRLVYNRPRPPPAARPVHRVRAPLTAGRPPMDRRLHARATPPTPNPARRTAPVRRQRDRLLMATALAVFASALTAPTIEDRQDAHPAILRRAIAFIDENAHTNITPPTSPPPASSPSAPSSSPIRRHRDTTPTDYLRRVRLDHAHRDLITGGPANESVTAVAYRWGFPSASRFTAYYRQAYGVLPATPCASEARGPCGMPINAHAFAIHQRHTGDGRDRRAPVRRVGRFLRLEPP